MDWTQRSVLVTGGTGFIGSNLVDRLLELGAKVVVADQLMAPNVSHNLWKARLDRCLAIYKEHGVEPNVEIIDLSTERDRLKHVLSKNEIDTLFMLSAVFGGRAFVDKQQSLCGIGFAIDQNTIRACHESGTVERINYASSACVYPPSLQKADGYLLKEEDVLSKGEGFASSDNLYGFQKLMTELTLRVLSEEHGLKTSSCRFLTVYGAGEFPSTHAISMLCGRALRREDPFVVWGSGLQSRGFTYVTDINEGQILAAEKIADGTAVNLGWDKRYKIRDVVNTILEIVGYQPRLVFDTSKPEGPFSRALDISLAKKLLGWTPKIDLREGLQMTINWMRQQIFETGAST